MRGSFTFASHEDVPCSFVIEAGSLDELIAPGLSGPLRQEVVCAGELLLVNTVEAFKKADKQGIINAAAADVRACTCVCVHAGTMSCWLVSAYLVVLYSPCCIPLCARRSALWMWRGTGDARDSQW